MGCLLSKMTFRSMAKSFDNDTTGNVTSYLRDWEVDDMMRIDKEARISFYKKIDFIK